MTSNRVTTTSRHTVFRPARTLALIATCALIAALAATVNVPTASATTINLLPKGSATWKKYCVQLDARQLRRLPRITRRKCKRVRKHVNKQKKLHLFSPHKGYIHRRKVAWKGSVIATWYGPGFYGRRTGCGSTLTTETWGVAHKTMPCGTLVAVEYNGKKVAVPVVDRGPYSGATFDLTGKVRNYFGFNGAGAVKYGIVKGGRVPLKRL